MNSEKLCLDCNIPKETSLFSRDKKIKDGYSSYCKPCSSIRHKDWTIKNKTHLTSYRQERYIENKERILEINKKYRESHKEVIKVKKKEYANKNRDKISTSRKNPERRFEYSQSMAKQKNLPWEIELKDYLFLISLPCYYCQDSLSKVSKSSGIGLDRLNNDKTIGYRLDNVVTCCKICNKIKNNFLTKEETLAAVEAVVKIRGMK